MSTDRLPPAAVPALWGGEAQQVLALCDEAEQLAEAATPGPWERARMVATNDGESAEMQADPNGDCVLNVADCGFDSDSPQADAAFIARSRDLVPALARALRAALAAPPPAGRVLATVEGTVEDHGAIATVRCDGDRQLTSVRLLLETFPVKDGMRVRVQVVEVREKEPGK